MSALKPSLITLTLERYLRAVKGREPGFGVTQVVTGMRGGRGRGAEAGRDLHARLLNLDPYALFEQESWASPLPLAWRFRWGWLYGVPDELVFERDGGGYRVSVIEYKSYSPMAREKAQASLYGLLTMLNLAVKPRVYVADSESLMPVPSWEPIAYEVLQRFEKRLAQRAS
ncbi:hypothetical protein [Infirmifilum sp. SLHALR2]|nr:MAG: hypothetical protein B7L53_06395 [Thermofilum sp. NZ13]